MSGMDGMSGTGFATRERAYLLDEGVDDGCVEFD